MYKIGYYIHHHGEGHRQRALAIARQIPGCFTLIGTGVKGRSENIDYLELDNDLPSAGQKQKPSLTATHYTPLYHRGIKRRMAKLANWIALYEPALLVVDVSVEIAMLARLCATPFVYVRLAGERLDDAHLEAFRAAEALLCPFHPVLEQRNMPSWIIQKSQYFASLTGHKLRGPVQKNSIAIVLGSGGHEISLKEVIDMAKQLPDWQIKLLGMAAPPGDMPSNLQLLGWVDNPHHHIASAAIIIGPAGDGLLSEVIASGKPYICLPQARPFNEQKSKAEGLKKIKAAIICKSWPKDWPPIIAKALKRGTIMNLLHDEASLEKACEFLLNIAHGNRRVNFTNKSLAKRNLRNIK